MLYLESWWEITETDMWNSEHATNWVLSVIFLFLCARCFFWKWMCCSLLMYVLYSIFWYFNNKFRFLTKEYFSPSFACMWGGACGVLFNVLQLPIYVTKGNENSLSLGNYVWFLYWMLWDFWWMLLVNLQGLHWNDMIIGGQDSMDIICWEMYIL